MGVPERGRYIRSQCQKETDNRLSSTFLYVGVPNVVLHLIVQSNPESHPYVHRARPKVSAQTPPFLPYLIPHDPSPRNDQLVQEFCVRGYRIPGRNYRVASAKIRLEKGWGAEPCQIPSISEWHGVQ